MPKRNLGIVKGKVDKRYYSKRKSRFGDMEIIIEPAIKGRVSRDSLIVWERKKEMIIGVFDGVGDDYTDLCLEITMKEIENGNLEIKEIFKRINKELHKKDLLAVGALARIDEKEIKIISSGDPFIFFAKKDRPGWELINTLERYSKNKDSIKGILKWRREITRCLGLPEEVFKPKEKKEEWKNGSRLLICTDGLGDNLGFFHFNGHIVDKRGEVFLNNFFKEKRGLAELIKYIREIKEETKKESLTAKEKDGFLFIPKTDDIAAILLMMKKEEET